MHFTVCKLFLNKKDSLFKCAAHGNFSGMVSVGITGMDNNTRGFILDRSIFFTGYSSGCLWSNKENMKKDPVFRLPWIQVYHS